MDAQDMDRALDAALKDLERTDEPIQPMRALIAAVVLIGRRLVPARTSASDETMPGRRVTRFVDHQRWERRMAERRADAGVLPSGRLDPLQGFTPGLRQDPPRPQVRDRLAGTGPAAERAVTTAEREIWRRDREELADALTLRRDLCVTLGLPPQSSDALVRAAARTLAEDRRMLLAEHERLEGVLHADAARAESLRAGLRNALGLRSNALDSAIIAAVNEAGEVMRESRDQVAAARKVLEVACNIDVFHDPPLKLSALAERAARRIATLLEEHQRERTAVDELRREDVLSDPGVDPSEPPDTIANVPQPPPTGDGEPVLEWALELNGLTPRIKHDLRARAGTGLVKYGTVLKTRNGRVALVDAYQEALDAIMYTTQDWIEHKSTGTTQKAVALALRLAEELEARGL